MKYTKDKVKWILKAELAKRSISVPELVFLLNREGVDETISSVNSKLSRGTFSAVFFLQCLSVISCKNIEIEEYESNFNIAAELKEEYISSNNG